MAVAAAEVAVGLAIIVDLFRTRQSVDIDTINLLKGVDSVVYAVRGDVLAGTSLAFTGLCKPSVAGDDHF